MLFVEDVTAFIETIAPLSLALPGDPVGLQLGHRKRKVKNIYVALDPDFASVKAAIKAEADLLVTHHPLFFEKIAALNEEEPAGALAAFAMRAGLNIYSAHTNYDCAPQGVSVQLAKALKLPLNRAMVLQETYREEFLKLVVFIPPEYADKMRVALSAAGAGQMGRYTGATFAGFGTGTFTPEEGAGPFIGEVGRPEETDEIRLETILPATKKAEVLKALLKAHPYEEPAYDFYPLVLPKKVGGLGLVITFEHPIEAEKLAVECAARLPLCQPRLKLFGKSRVKKIALLGGSGGSLIEQAKACGAELFLAGDFRYHDLLKAESYGLSLLDAGHGSTEMPGVVYLYGCLKQFVKEGKHRAKVTLRPDFSGFWPS